MKVILALLLASVVFASGCIGNPENNKINYKGIDGKTKTVDITGKNIPADMRGNLWHMDVC